MKEFILRHLDTFGLTLNLFGTILMAFFIGKDENEWVEGEGKPGEKWYALLIYHPRWLHYGMALLIIGFVLSLIHSLVR